MNRDTFPTRRILLRTEMQRHAAHAMINSMPLDDSKPLEIIGREEAKARKLDQNALMWVGPLADIAQQAYHQGRTYSAEIWHELFKVMYLPEDDDPEINLLVKEGYRKWDYLPNGDRICVGSTTKLTVTGFSRYLEQVQAHGASMGVIFHANPRERMAR
ncbi:recombination protein NinB [Alcaligenes faecalis]|uniref:NinB family protein n=1 Tax=Alcaligenes faecalis TaxID=511 RepID=A0A2U2BHG2_ALCFA|nr:recombination protein NinB [Alcaligenes faecalis]PWE13454.1 hypothetical protein DF183_16765 [Alcaligenes faecalis]